MDTPQANNTTSGAPWAPWPDSPNKGTRGLIGTRKQTKEGEARRGVSVYNLKPGMVNSQMGVQESLANPANLVRLRITLPVCESSLQVTVQSDSTSGVVSYYTGSSSLPKNKKLLIRLALASVGSGRRFVWTVSKSVPRGLNGRYVYNCHCD